jgi:hypothetical protein
MARGLLGPPSTLLELADTANPLLPDFVDLMFLERRTRFPHIVIADGFQTALLVPMMLRVNGLESSW